MHGDYQRGSNENEIAEMANKGGVQGAISYLLDKGFILHTNDYETHKNRL